MVLTLYKMDASSPARSVFMVIEALKIPNVKYVDINLLGDDHLKNDFLKLNPQHTVPLFTDDDFVVWDSHAIVTYLLNAYGKNSSLYPTDPKERAIVDMRLHFDNGILYPAIRKNDEPIFFGTATSLTSEGIARITKGYEFTEKFLESTSWIAGQHLTVADISCVSSISTLNELFPIDKNLYPKVIDWWNRCSQYDFYKKGNEPGLIDFRNYLKEFLSRGK